jgi:hypothetical protein
VAKICGKKLRGKYSKKRKILRSEKEESSS